jgi:hypothetical protein
MLTQKFHTHINTKYVFLSPSNLMSMGGVNVLWFDVNPFR